MQETCHNSHEFSYYNYDDDFISIMDRLYMLPTQWRDPHRPKDIINCNFQA